VLSTSPIPSGGVVAVLRDVTSELANRDELTKLSVVASSTSNLVIITDAAGCIDWVNPAFEQRTGYLLGEVRGRKPGSFLQGEGTDPDAVERLRAAIANGMPASEELLNYSKSGEPYWIAVNLTPVTDAEGKVDRFISVQDDITERKRVELLKDQFVSTVSHELRTPLTAINGALGLLAGGVAGALPERAAPLLDIAQKNGERLTTLIDDLLDMERLAEGGMPIDSRIQPIMGLVDVAVADNEPYAATFGVQLRVADRCDDVAVDVDGLRFLQVMANLLSNACKFSPVGSAVDVTVNRDAQCVRIGVTDRGPGIPESFRDVIFDKFSQADSSDTRARGGTGLGLAISKELVERMGGTIGYQSSAGRGTTFFIDLPAH
jgi:PAS domain S-box-containing protein